MAESRHDSDTSAISTGHKVSVSEGIELVPTQTSSRFATDPRAQFVLSEANAIEHTAYSFSTTKKWWILTVVALCQTSMSKCVLSYWFILILTCVIRLQRGSLLECHRPPECRVQPG